MKRVISIIAIGLCLIALFSFPASAAEPVNLIKNGRPITSLSGWSSPSLSSLISLGFTPGSSSHLYALPTASGRTTGIQLDYSDFTLMSDIMYNFELDIELCYFAQNSTIEISVISSDSQNSIFNRTFTVNPSGSSLSRNKYTLEFACPVSGIYSFSVYSLSTGFGNYIPSYGGVRIYDLFISPQNYHNPYKDAVEGQFEDGADVMEGILGGDTPDIDLTIPQDMLPLVCLWFGTAGRFFTTFTIFQSVLVFSFGMWAVSLIVGLSMNKVDYYTNQNRRDNRNDKRHAERQAKRKKGG